MTLPPLHPVMGASPWQGRVPNLKAHAVACALNHMTLKEYALSLLEQEFGASAYDWQATPEGAMRPSDGALVALDHLNIVQISTSTDRMSALGIVRTEQCLQGLPNWIEQEWTKGTCAWSSPELQQYLQRMVGLPRKARELAIQYPLLCLVRTRPGVLRRVPTPGRLGVVHHTHEKGLPFRILVSDGPYAPTKAAHFDDPSVLEVVAYFRDATPDRMRVLFGLEGP